MPIEIGTEGIGEVYVGNESIGQVYAGLDLVWSKTSAATFITGHSVSLSTNGSYIQTVTGTVGATYTTSIETGTQTIGVTGSNTHSGTASAVAACSGNTITVTIAEVLPTLIDGANPSATDSNAQTGATGTSSSSTAGRITSGGVYPTSCTPAGSAADPSNPCSPTTTTTCSAAQFQNYRNRLIQNCDGTWDGSSYGPVYAEATGTTVTGQNTSATNTSYVPGTTEDGGVAQTPVWSGTCTATDTSVGCCPDATCTGQPGTEAGTIETIFTTTKDCDGSFVSSRSTTAPTSRSCSTASYPNPDSCSPCSGLAAPTATPIAQCTTAAIPPQIGCGTNLTSPTGFVSVSGFVFADSFDPCLNNTGNTFTYYTAADASTICDGSTSDGTAGSVTLTFSC